MASLRCWPGYFSAALADTATAVSIEATKQAGPAPFFDGSEFEFILNENCLSGLVGWLVQPVLDKLDVLPDDPPGVHPGVRLLLSLIPFNMILL